MKVLGLKTQRRASEWVAAVLVGLILVGLAEYFWFTLPRPGAGSRLLSGAADAFCLYRLIHAGNGNRNFAMRTAMWLSPLLVLQLMLQFLASRGAALG